MATASVQHAPGNSFGQIVEPLAQETKPVKHSVATELNYYQDPGDGSLPAPFYVGYVSFKCKGIYFKNSHSQQNTDQRLHTPQKVVVHDVSGDEQKYTLDSHGFQFVKHESQEKEFLYDQKIKAGYYPEVEQLLKDV
jgi:hypothetical protein